MSLSLGQPRPAVFLDRDGVLNRAIIKDGKPFPPQTVEEFALLPGTVEACQILSKIGPLIVVTNQPDVARGTLDVRVVEQTHALLRSLLPIARVEVCYEDGWNPDSQFYKPAPGMLKRAAAEMNLDLATSIMIGDRWRDVECGRAAGCLTIWIDRGYAEPLHSPPDHVVSDLPAAAALLDRLGKIPKEGRPDNS